MRNRVLDDCIATGIIPAILSIHSYRELEDSAEAMASAFSGTPIRAYESRCSMLFMPRVT
jgi:hypothetical protein